jgi:polar amino acid transport system substrate-binding protein
MESVVNICIFIKKAIKSIVCVVVFVQVSQAKTIKVAAIDWCPQICIDEEKPGYTVDLIKKVFEGSEYTLEIDIFPWTRAIEYVSNGSYDALLAPAKKEAPHLTFPGTAIGYQKMCFFTDKKSAWLYKDESSLKNMQIGIANDSSIEELNNYIKKNPKQFQYQPYHERYVVKNAQKVLTKRIDAFLFTKNTTIFELEKEKLNSQIRNAGCVSQADVYLAFTSVSQKQSQISKVIKYFDNEMDALIKTNEIDNILLKYGIQP